MLGQSAPSAVQDGKLSDHTIKALLDDREATTKFSLTKYHHHRERSRCFELSSEKPRKIIREHKCKNASHKAVIVISDGYDSVPHESGGKQGGGARGMFACLFAVKGLLANCCDRSASGQDSICCKSFLSVGDIVGLYHMPRFRVSTPAMANERRETDIVRRIFYGSVEPFPSELAISILVQRTLIDCRLFDAFIRPLVLPG
jgi:hypothetical protein